MEGAGLGIHPASDGALSFELLYFSDPVLTASVYDSELHTECQ